MPARPDKQLLRVLVLPSWYPTERYPMGGIFCQEQARALNRVWELDVAVLFVDRAPVREWLRRAWRRAELRYESGLKVYRSYMPRVPGVWPLLYVGWTLVSLWRFSRRYSFRPDIVHAHVTLPAGLAGVLVRRVAGVPLVITEHTGPFSLLMRNRPAARATAAAIRSADRVVAVSRALREQIWAYPQLRRHIDIIPNVVDVNAFSARRVGRDEAEPPVLLFVGEMETSIKGVDYLLGAIHILREQGHEVRLHLVGDGRLRREYEATARRMGVADVCLFHGRLPHEEVARLMSEADLFVLPSLAETFGVVLAEALAAGLPVVATRCGGPEEIVTEDVGALVEPANSLALAEGIAGMLSRLGEFQEGYLRAEAESRYGQASVAGRLVTLYRQVVGRSR